jgi:hypothetical protein
MNHNETMIHIEIVVCKNTFHGASLGSRISKLISGVEEVNSFQFHVVFSLAQIQCP